jgi:hypothetical protein
LESSWELVLQLIFGVNMHFLHFSPKKYVLKVKANQCWMFQKKIPCKAPVRQIQNKKLQ